MFEANAILLAGGASRRMGQDKALLDWHGIPLLQHLAGQLQPHFGEVLISGDPARYAFTGLRVVEDLRPDQGPLMGLYSAMRASGAAWNFVMACDMVDAPLPVLRALHAGAAAGQCVVPLLPDGIRQPLFAFYHRDTLPVMEAILGEGRRAVQTLLERCAVGEVPGSEAALRSANTPEAYRALRDA